MNGVVDRIIGGWTFGLSSRLQSGQLVNLGNVRLFGMTRDEVQDMYKLRFDDANKFVYMLPQDVIDETIKAFSVSATSATGYGTGGRAERPLLRSGQRPGLHRSRQQRRRLRHR